jgi:hypothetical protein
MTAQAATVRAEFDASSRVDGSVSTVEQPLSGPEPQQAKDVAEMLGRASEQLGPTRSRLIDKGLLYTPGHVLAAFTVPQFDRYMRRSYVL